jgi:acetolactate synthase-1/2/3 large subunit
MADANASGVPVVVLAGRTPTTAWKRGAIQDVDQLALARVVSKWAHTCLAPERLGEYVTDAMWHARAPRPGVAYVELPTDVLLAEGPPELGWQPGYPEHLEAPRAAPEAIDRLIRLLAEAERPVVIAGSGAFWGEADDALRTFAETTKIPVTTTGPARGLVPDSHPVCLGGLVHGGIAVVQADVVVILGSRFDGNMLYGGPPLYGSWQTIVQIDVRAEAFGGNRAPEMAVQGDVAQVLRQLVEAWDAPPKEAWLARARADADASRQGWDEQSQAPAAGVHTGLLAQEINAVAQEVSGGDCTLVCDGGDALTWGIAHFGAEHPGRVLTTGTALGTLGVGVPFALGAKAARPDEPVFCLVGDGAFGLSAMELDTAARHDLPIVFVVSNNAAWGDVMHEQREWFGEDRLVGSALAATRYEKLAEMVGGYGVAVDDPADLRPALRKAAESGELAVVNVKTDPTVVSEILRGISQLGVM